MAGPPGFGVSGPVSTPHDAGRFRHDGRMDPSSWTERYAEGRHAEVWHELRQAGDRVRGTELEEPARAVCDEMARRARHNVETLVGRLREQGYLAHLNDETESPLEPWIPPTPDAPGHVAWLEERFGPVPFALTSWMRIVGDVWLVGTHPDWPESSAADPLVLQVEGSHFPRSSFRDRTEMEHEAWREAELPDGEPFRLPLAPDHLHKANVSGGDPYGVLLPDATAAGTWMGEQAMSFPAYLDHVFRSGGFPGSAPGDGQWRVRQSLAEGLLRL